MEQGKNKIFISHSSKDSAIVSSFVETVLRLGLNIPAERIFCTSIEARGVTTGEFIPDRLKDEIQKSALAILCISNNYKNSEVCLNELGAAWAVLDKKRVVPLLLPGFNHKSLGFLDANRLSLKISNISDLQKFVDDHKGILNPDYALQTIIKKLEAFVKQLPTINTDNTPEKKAREFSQNESMVHHLYSFSNILGATLPLEDSGYFHLTKEPEIERLLINLRDSNIKNRIWYRFSGGDDYLDEVRKLPNGNWSISQFNTEIMISEAWLKKSHSLAGEFILIRTENLGLFQIDSDKGGEDVEVAVLGDGTTISITEYNNGRYQILNKIREIDYDTTERRSRFDGAKWIFLFTDYHKMNSDPQRLIEISEELDKKPDTVDKDILMKIERQINKRNSRI